MSETLADAGERERVQYLENEVFDDVVGAEVRLAEDDEWGDYVIVVGEDVTWLEKDDKSLEEWAKLAVKGEDEFFFEKVMYKHPTWPQDTVCLSFRSLEDNPFR